MPTKTNYGAVPSAQVLNRWVGAGMTRSQMVDEIERLHGVRVTPAAVSMALGRAGLTRKNARYNDLIPWKVEMRHQSRYLLQLLRMEARRRRGLPLVAEQESKLEHFLRTLKEEKVVVDYRPETEEGFWLVPRDKRDGRNIIRRP